MKKILFFLLACLFSANIFAVELWNGFNSDMNVDDFMAHSREVLETDEKVEEVKKVYFTLSHDHKGNPECDVIGLCSPAPQFNQYSGVNILAYFYTGKLYAVIVRWDMAGKELLKRTKKEWGNPAKVPIQPNSYETFYMWDQNDRYVYLLTVQGPASTFYIDQKVKDDWVYTTENAKAIAEQKELAEKKANRESVLNSVILTCNEGDIWNGIKTDMTIDDCYVYYQTDLDYGKIYKEQRDFPYVPNNLPYAETECLSLTTEKEGYNQSIWESDLTEVNTKAFYDVRTYFYNGKAIAVYLEYTLGEKDMRMLLNSKYNFPQKTKKSYSDDSFVGVINNNDVYLYGSDRDCRLWFVNKDFAEVYKADMKKKQERSKEPNF